MKAFSYSLFFIWFAILLKLNAQDLEGHWSIRSYKLTFPDNTDTTILVSNIAYVNLTESSFSFFWEPCPEIPTVTYEGKIYNTVKIENQCWIKENLNVGTMINGNQNQSNNGTIEKYC